MSIIYALLLTEATGALIFTIAVCVYLWRDHAASRLSGAAYAKSGALDAAYSEGYAAGRADGERKVTNLLEKPRGGATARDRRLYGDDEQWCMCPTWWRDSHVSGHRWTCPMRKITAGRDPEAEQAALDDVREGR